MYQTNHKHQSCSKGFCLHKWAAHLHFCHQTTSLFPGWDVLYRWLNWPIPSNGTPTPHSADKTEHPHKKIHEDSSLHPIQPLEDPRDSSRTPVLLPSCWGQQDLKNWLDKAVYSVGLLNRRLSLKYYQVRKTKSSVPRKWFTRWLVALCQSNQERSLLIPSFKKHQPTKPNIRGWSRKIWPIKVGNKEKIPRGIFSKLLNANAFNIICTKIKLYQPLISLVPSIFPQKKVWARLCNAGHSTVLSSSCSTCSSNTSSWSMFCQAQDMIPPKPFILTAALGDIKFPGQAD